MSKQQKKFCDVQRENKELNDQLEALKAELDCNNKKDTVSSEEYKSKIAELKIQAKSWCAKLKETEGQLKDAKVKLQEEICREQQLLSKDEKCKEELCEKQKELCKLSNVIKSMAEELKEKTADLESEQGKNCELESKLQTVCAALNELKDKVKEKEATIAKLHLALNQLSNKFVSRRLDNNGCVRHFQEECAKYEALYNATACKLKSREVEVTSMALEIERLKCELEHQAEPCLQNGDDSYLILVGRVKELSDELQDSHFRQASLEAMLKDRDKLIADLEKAQGEVTSLKLNNSDLHCAIKKIEDTKSQLTERMRNMQRLICESQEVNHGSHGPLMQPNIELQREISTVLSSQLRGVKQKLHSTRHDYKMLQTAYDELNHKYSLLRMGERDVDQVKAIKSKTQCVPCTSKASKSAGHVENTEENEGIPACAKWPTQSKSWHKLKSSDEFKKREQKWKEKLQSVIRGQFMDVAELKNNSSSSN